MTVKEAAELLGVSEQYIRCGIKQGELPGSAVKVGKKRYTYHIPEEAMRAYINGGTAK